MVLKVMQYMSSIDRRQTEGRSFCLSSWYLMSLVILYDGPEDEARKIHHHLTSACEVYLGTLLHQLSILILGKTEIMP